MSKSRKVQNLEDDLSASDDEAPEEMGMSVIKERNLSQAQHLRNQNKKSREVEKERRRKRNEMFKLQKEKKLENINKRALALPNDVLEAVSMKSAKLSTEAAEEAESSNKPGDDDPGFIEDLEDRLSDSGVEDDSNVNEDDYIPLNSTNHGNFNVVTMQSFQSKKKSTLEAAVEFRDKRLFGSQSTQRESAKQRQAKKEKKRFKCL